MSERRWRGALIGCGFFAPNHLHAWKSIPEARIVALCDIEISKAQALGKVFGIEAIYDDPNQLLEREEIDFLDIVTSPASHRSVVESGARHGKAIICQKPFAEALEDADAMVAACQHAQVPLVVHENFRWQRPFREIARCLREGAVGQVQGLRLVFRHDYSDKYRNQPYLANVERLALMDVGVHLFDLVRVLMGDVRSLHCRTQRLNPRVRGEDSFVASCEHSAGGVSLIDCSFFVKGHRDFFPQTFALIAGSCGGLELKAGYRLDQYRAQRGAEPIRSESSIEPDVPSWGARPWHVIQDSVINFQRHVIDVLEGRAQPQPSGAHSRDTLALVLAAYESAAHDRVVHFNGLGERLS